MNINSLMSYSVTFILYTLIFCSCGNHYTVKTTMRQFVKENIEIPENIIMVENKICKPIDVSRLNSLKLIVYVDSLTCSSCRINRFAEMLPIYELAENEGTFSVMAIFSPKSDKLDMVKRQLMLLEFPYPIYIDISREFVINNFIPEDNRFHCFLIDNLGQVQFVGNPTASEQLKSIFLNILHNLNN